MKLVFVLPAQANCVLRLEEGKAYDWEYMIWPLGQGGRVVTA